MPRRPLPEIMVAPNGARRMQSVHPALPLTDDAVVETARDCVAAGAQGLHAHIRDADGRHLLDAERYRALVERLHQTVPGAYIQVTSESGGIYDAAAQMELLRDLKPANVSIALRELVPAEDDWPEAERFYAWAYAEGIDIQHILYTPAEVKRFLAALQDERIPGAHHLVLFVLGTYDGTVTSRPEGLSDYTALLKEAPESMSFDWMLCAFGPAETECLLEAFRQGGKARIGFENSLWNADGTMAASNAERVRELVQRRAAELHAATV